MTKAKTTATPIEVPAESEPATEEIFSAKDLAKELNLDAKSFRRWLRSVTPDRANKGGRWIFNADAKAALIELYNTRHTAGTTPALPDADA